ncbi:MAG: HdeD family acid-resistance protein [Bacteroidales bacterium]|nr:HdeD family acid-resistance protein [Bacteroidales bacterium]
MRTEFFESLCESVKNWWISLLIGILFVVGALLLMFNPLVSYAVLAIGFAVFMFVEGIFEIIFSISNKNILPGWGWYLALGILDLILGTFLLIYPGLSAAVIPYILAFWLMFRGFSIIGSSIELKQFGNKNWGWYLALGILSVLCAIGIIFFPVAGAFSVIYILAFTFLFLGIARILLAFELKGLKKDCDRVQKRIDESRKRELRY